MRTDCAAAAQTDASALATDKVRDMTATIEAGAGAGWRARRDHVAGLPGRERRNIRDDAGKGEHQAGCFAKQELVRLIPKLQMSLEQALELAGGTPPEASLWQISIDRVEAHERHVTLTVPIPPHADAVAVKAALAGFEVGRL